MEPPTITNLGTSKQLIYTPETLGHLFFLPDVFFLQLNRNRWMCNGDPQLSWSGSLLQQSRLLYMSLSGGLHWRRVDLWTNRQVLNIEYFMENARARCLRTISLIGRIIFLTCENKTFTILSGRIFFFSFKCEKHRLLDWLELICIWKFTPYLFSDYITLVKSNWWSIINAFWLVELLLGYML